MAMKLREKIIILSRSEKIEKNFYIYCWTAFIFFIICFIAKLRILAIILAIMSLGVIFFYHMAIAIKKQPDDKISKNKLLYLVLCDRDAVEHYVELIMVFPVLWIITEFIEINFIFGCVYIAISLIIIFKVPKIINNVFAKKLS